MNSDIHALVGPYVVDALDDDERAAFEEHLDACGSCLEEVITLGEVTPLLASTVAAPVPAHLRASVLAEVDRTPQERPARPNQPTVSAPSFTAAPRNRFVTGLLAAAAAIMVVIGAIGFVSVRSADQRAEEAESALLIYEAPDRSTATFEGDLGSIQVTTSASVGATVITGTGVPELAEGRTYEAWFVDENGPIPAGTFTADGGTIDHRIDGVAPATVAITEEPAGGSPQPTGPILASASIGA